MELAVPVAVFLALIATSEARSRRRRRARPSEGGIHAAVIGLWEASRSPWPWVGTFLVGTVVFGVSRARDPYGWVDDVQSLALLIVVLGGFVLFALLPATAPGPSRASTAQLARIAAGGLGAAGLLLAALWGVLVALLAFEREACGGAVETEGVVAQVVLGAPAILLLVVVGIAGLDYARRSPSARLGSQVLWVPALSLLLPWLWVVLRTYSC